MTKHDHQTEKSPTERRAPEPAPLWELGTDESYAAWLRAERQLRHQRHLLPLERR